MMVIGAVIVAIAMLVLGFTKEIVSYFIADPETAKFPTVFLAVLAIYVVDFAINAGEKGTHSCHCFPCLSFA